MKLPNTPLWTQPITLVLFILRCFPLHVVVTFYFYLKLPFVAKISSGNLFYGLFAVLSIGLYVVLYQITGIIAGWLFKASYGITCEEYDLHKNS